MTIPLVVRRSGMLADISIDGPDPRLPKSVIAVAAPNLTYTHTRFLRGAEQFGADGSKRRVELTNRRLYDISPEGRLQTSFGCMPRTAASLRAAGHAVRFVDISSPRERPDCYQADWKVLDRLKLEWRPRQKECVESILGAFGGVINSPPAFGKTEIIGRIALLYPKAKIAVVTKRKDVSQTIMRRLSKLVPNVGFVGDGKRKYSRVTCYIAKSLHKADPDTDILLADEGHELVSDSFCELIFRSFVNSRNFAFSATPKGRSDGNDARLEYLFGPEIFHMEWKEATNLGLIVPVEVRWLNIQLDRNPIAGYSSDIARKRHGIWRNTERNAAIAAAARTHAEGEQILILVETIEHAIMLGRMLPEFQLCYDKIDPDVVEAYKAEGVLDDTFSPMTPQRRENMRRDFEDNKLKRVIATDVWSTGVSFEQLGVLIRADARSSEIMDDQAPGRVVRIHDGKQSAIIYDCWDMFDQGYKRKSQERWRRYEQKGWIQHRTNVLETQP